jgi:hypothetical protein
MTVIQSTSTTSSAAGRSDSPSRAEPKADRSFEDALKRAKEQAMSRDDLPVVIAGPNAAAVSPVVQGAAAAGLVDPAQLAHLDKIAAAIAELRPQDGDAQVHIALPPGPLPFDGALIARGANGAMTIMLTSAEAIAPAVGAQLRGELRDRLAKRGVQVARVGLAQSDERQLAQASAGDDAASARAR